MFHNIIVCTVFKHSVLAVIDMICVKILNMLQWKNVLCLNRKFLLNREQNFLFNKLHEHERKLEFPKVTFKSICFNLFFYIEFSPEKHTYPHTQISLKKNFLFVFRCFCHFKHVFREVNRRVLNFLLLSIRVFLFHALKFLNYT